VAGDVRHHTAEQRERTHRRQSDPQHRSSPARGLDGQCLELQAGQARCRTDPDLVPLDDSVPIAEVHDDLEQTVWKGPFANAGQLAVKEPDEIHQTGQVRSATLAVPPSPKRAIDNAGADAQGGTID
jgi:hypothetical protein